jgi:diaminopimelate epimerase
MKFIKMYGCGNDFMIIDSRTQSVSLTSQRINLLSNYKKSIGFDQLILIESSKSNDIAIKIFNSDGSLAQACGNGSRCVAKLILEESKKNIITISTANRILTAYWQDELVAINMGKANLIEEDIDFDHFKGSLVDIGNPHVIINNQEDYLKHGPIIECDPRFPNKTNVNFTKIIDRNTIYLNTWERGAGATLACGTGSCASFFYLNQKGLVNNKIEVQQKGGNLSISLNDNQEIIMAGEAEISYKGIIDYKYNS